MHLLMHPVKRNKKSKYWKLKVFQSNIHSKQKLSKKLQIHASSPIKLKANNGKTNTQANKKTGTDEIEHYCETEIDLLVIDLNKTKQKSEFKTK